MSYDTASAALALSAGGGKLLLIPVIERGGKTQRRLIREALIIEVSDDERNTTLRLATTEIIETSLTFDEVHAMLTSFI